MREIEKNSNSVQNFSLFTAVFSDNTWHARTDIYSKILTSRCSEVGNSQSCDHSIEIPLGRQRGAAGKRRRFVIQLANTLESLRDRIQQPNVFSSFIPVHWLHREISGCNLHRFTAEQLVEIFCFFFWKWRAQQCETSLWRSFHFHESWCSWGCANKDDKICLL